MKLRTNKAFREAVDAAYETQENRETKKREYDTLRKSFDEQHETLCEYAVEHPEVFETGEAGKSREGTTGKVKYKMTSGEALERIDGGSLTDKAWLNTLPDEFVRQKPELNKLAIKGANLSDDELEDLGLRRVETQNMRFCAEGAKA